jgi:hypothetical protein
VAFLLQRSMNSMKSIRLGLVLLASLPVAACAGRPTGPDVLALPGTGRTFDEFHADDRVCRQAATDDIGEARGDDAQRAYDMRYVQCMYAKGHQVPVPGGRPSYTSGSSPATQRPAAIPPPPAGTPPPKPPGEVTR